MGLKDQSMALKWVHDNIEFFGGDPKKITLAGLSAGGASVHYHYMSPYSAGLFQNGISLSGTALMCWAQTENSLEKAKKLAALMGCPTDNSKSLIECLKYRPARSVVDAVDNFLVKDIFFLNLYSVNKIKKYNDYFLKFFFLVLYLKKKKEIFLNYFKIVYKNIISAMALQSIFSVWTSS